MKIGIISRHDIFNYGSCLQAYALQCAIEQLGHNAEYINYVRPDEYSWHRIFGDLKESKMNKNILTKAVYIMMGVPGFLLERGVFRKAQKEYLKCGEITQDRKKLYRCDYDKLCTGSDQVWNRIHHEIETAYFLADVPEQTRRFSYAASLGKSFIEDDDKTLVRDMLEKYEAVTVRESSGVTALADIGISAEQVVDPVLLFDRSFWDELADKAKNIPKKKYILIYQLHFSEYINECLESVCAEQEYEIIIVCSDYKKMLKRTVNRPHGYVLLPTVEEFIALIKNAEYVITDSFHGTVFSIIYGKNFVDVLPDTNTARNIDLLHMLELDERIVTDDKNVDVINCNIDYDNPYKLLDAKRKDSWQKLKSMIEQ